MPLANGFETNVSCEYCPARGEGSFCGLQPPTLKAFESIRFTSRYPKGAVLFVEQDAPRGIFVLCKGRVKLTMTSIEGRTMILRMVGPGEVLGLHAVVSGTPYQATAETMEPCQLNFVRRDEFLRFLRDHAEASIQAAKQLSENYQVACTQIRSLGLTHSASAKLAKFLLETSEDGQITKQGMRVRLALTHEEIGQMIGASRETVTRTMAQFKQKQLVAQNGSFVLIQDRAALENCAGS
jgi:CRP/FNR family transcriptional regulator, cyclic AMP receptor protein